MLHKQTYVQILPSGIYVKWMVQFHIWAFCCQSCSFDLKSFFRNFWFQWPIFWFLSYIYLTLQDRCLYMQIITWAWNKNAKYMKDTGPPYSLPMHLCSCCAFLRTQGTYSLMTGCFKIFFNIVLQVVATKTFELSSRWKSFSNHWIGGQCVHYSWDTRLG